MWHHRPTTPRPRRFGCLKRGRCLNSTLGRTARALQRASRFNCSAGGTRRAAPRSIARRSLRPSGFSATSRSSMARDLQEGRTLSDDSPQALCESSGREHIEAFVLFYLQTLSYAKEYGQHRWVVEAFAQLAELFDYAARRVGSHIPPVDNRGAAGHLTSIKYSTLQLRTSRRIVPD